MTIEPIKIADSIEFVAQNIQEPEWHGDPLVRTINDAVLTEEIKHRLRKKIDRFSQLSLIASRNLLPEAETVNRSRVGVFIGNDLAGWNYVHRQLSDLIETRDAAVINPYVATAWFPAAAQGEITITHNILGDSKTFSAGMLSSGLALEHATRMINTGKLDYALVGGVEAPDAPIVLKALQMENRISVRHPAAEAIGMIALQPNHTSGTVSLVMSFPRRTVQKALDDVAGHLSGFDEITHLETTSCEDNQTWKTENDEIRNAVVACFGSRLKHQQPDWNGMDVGAAHFALLVHEANKLALQHTPSIVVGTDFSGLYMAAAIYSTDGVMN